MGGEEFADLVGALYSGAADDQDLVTFVRSLEMRLNSAVALFLDLPAHRDPGVVVAPTIEPGFIKAYQEHFFSLDPVVRATHALADGAIAVVRRPRGSDPCDSAFHREWLEPQGLHSGPALLGLIERRPDARAAALLTFPRTARSIPSPAKQRLVSALMPHLRTTLHLRDRMDVHRKERDAFTATLDRLRIGLAFVDERARLVWKNWAAARMLEANDGLSDEGGAVRAWAATTSETLDRASHRATGIHAPHASLFMAPRPSGLPPFAVAVIPARSRDEAPSRQRRLAAIVITDLAAKNGPSMDTVQRLYGLTPAQAALAWEMVQGHSLEEAAQQLGITRETVRTRLKQIFIRTGTHRQVELVQLLLTNPMQILRDE